MMDNTTILLRISTEDKHKLKEIALKNKTTMTKILSDKIKDVIIEDNINSILNPIKKGF